jgi:hypothetical protein
VSATASTPSPWPGLMVLMGGVILSGISAQAATFAINDQGGGWHVSADSASWFSTAYAMTEAAVIPAVPFLIVGWGMRHLAIAAGLLFAATVALLGSVANFCRSTRVA